MPAGRPTKYTEEMPEKILDYVGNQGKSITQFAKEVQVNKDTVYQWAKDYPEFSDALLKAQEWSQAVWEEKLEDMMTSRDVNSALVKLYFANRFNWRDRQDVDHSGEIKTIRIKTNVDE